MIQRTNFEFVSQNIKRHDCFTYVRIRDEMSGAIKSHDDARVSFARFSLRHNYGREKLLVRESDENHQFDLERH